MPPASAEGRRPRYRWVILAAATMVQASVSLAQHDPVALGPALLVGLGIGHAGLGLLTCTLIGGMATTTLLAGVQT